MPNGVPGTSIVELYMHSLRPREPMTPKVAAAELEMVLETGIATLKLEDDADLSNKLLEKTIMKAGFEVAKIARTFESEFPDVNPPETD